MKVDQGGFDYDLYSYAAPVAGDWTKADALARNPSPLARDFWEIPRDNNTLAMTEVDADGGEQEIASLKGDGGGTDINLYLYHAPAPGDWVYWDAYARNPSPLARDFWVIPQGDDAEAICGLDTTGDGDSDSLVVVRNDGGDYLVYLWNMPQAGDWTYWDAVSRNPSPLARDFWVIPQRNDIADVAGIASPLLAAPLSGRGIDGGMEDRLATVENAAGDFNFYLWNAPITGDWTRWDAVSRNPSPLARDFWQIPAGNHTVGMAAPR
jgi:hypothetical protein